jgi:N-acetylornithine carbamoyltransferase
VLSWVYHPKALPLAVPSAVLHMAAMRGMEVVVARPPGFDLPPEIMDKARAAAASGGSVTRDRGSRRGARGASVLYAKEWGSTAHYGDLEADAQLRAQLKDWCVREQWFSAARPMPSSCIACRCAATLRSPTKCWTDRAPRSSARLSIA